MHFVNKVFEAQKINESVTLVHNTSFFSTDGYEKKQTLLCGEV